MIRWNAVCGAVVSLCMSAGSAWAQQSPRLITVQGEAALQVPPDKVVLTFGVETQEPLLADSRHKNDEIVKRVVDAVTTAGVKAQHIQTDYLSIEPVFDPFDRKHENLVGFRCRKSIVAEVEDVDTVDAVVSAALDAGANYMHGIQFKTTELRKHRDHARALAVRAAREKAVALAGELGQGVGSPYAIHEIYGGWHAWNSAGWWGGRRGDPMTQNVIQPIGGQGMTSDSTIAPGQISITARVSVQFELVAPPQKDQD